MLYGACLKRLMLFYCFWYWRIGRVYKTWFWLVVCSDFFSPSYLTNKELLLMTKKYWTVFLLLTSFLTCTQRKKAENGLQGWFWESLYVTLAFSREVTFLERIVSLLSLVLCDGYLFWIVFFNSNWFQSFCRLCQVIYSPPLFLIVVKALRHMLQKLRISFCYIGDLNTHILKLMSQTIRATAGPKILVLLLTSGLRNRILI